VRALGFSPDNRHLAVLSDQGTVSIALLRPRDLIAQTCARLRTNISADDWARFVGREPYRVLCPHLETGRR
jgi:hypothetical protein